MRLKLILIITLLSVLLITGFIQAANYEVKHKGNEIFFYEDNKLMKKVNTGSQIIELSYDNDQVIIITKTDMFLTTKDGQLLHKLSLSFTPEKVDFFREELVITTQKDNEFKVTVSNNKLKLDLFTVRKINEGKFYAKNNNGEYVIFYDHKYLYNNNNKEEDIILLANTEEKVYYIKNNKLLKSNQDFDISEVDNYPYDYIQNQSLFNNYFKNVKRQTSYYFLEKFQAVNLKQEVFDYLLGNLIKKGIENSDRKKVLSLLDNNNFIENDMSNLNSYLNKLDNQSKIHYIEELGSKYLLVLEKLLMDFLSNGFTVAQSKETLDLLKSNDFTTVENLKSYLSNLNKEVKIDYIKQLSTRYPRSFIFEKLLEDFIATGFTVAQSKETLDLLKSNDFTTADNLKSYLSNLNKEVKIDYIEQLSAKYPRSFIFNELLADLINQNIRVSEANHVLKLLESNNFSNVNNLNSYFKNLDKDKQFSYLAKLDLNTYYNLISILVKNNHNLSNRELRVVYNKIDSLSKSHFDSILSDFSYIKDGYLKCFIDHSNDSYRKEKFLLTYVNKNINSLSDVNHLDYIRKHYQNIKDYQVENLIAQIKENINFDFDDYYKSYSFNPAKINDFFENFYSTQAYNHLIKPLDRKTTMEVDYPEDASHMTITFEIDGFGDLLRLDLPIDTYKVEEWEDETKYEKNLIKKYKNSIEDYDQVVSILETLDNKGYIEKKSLSKSWTFKRTELLRKKEYDWKLKDYDWDSSDNMGYGVIEIYLGNERITTKDLYVHYHPYEGEGFLENNEAYYSINIGVGSLQGHYYPEPDHLVNLVGEGSSNEYLSKLNKAITFIIDEYVEYRYE